MMNQQHTELYHTSQSLSKDISDRQSMHSPDSLDDEPSQSHSHSGKVKKRGRKPSKVDVKGRLEKSRQSARECRARKKLRYQYCEELVADRERAIFSLRDELELYRKVCHKIDQGIIPNEAKKLVEEMRPSGQPQASTSKNQN